MATSSAFMEKDKNSFGFPNRFDMPTSNNYTIGCF